MTLTAPIRPLQFHPESSSDENIELSIVVPAFNEEESLEAFYDTLCGVLDKTDVQWELIIVNDGSRDRTGEIVQNLHKRDSRVHGIMFARNFGHQIALTAGLEYAHGRAVITMDADLQHPPEMITEMLRLWREGNHVVYTIRSYGPEVSKFKRMTSDCFYTLINKLSNINVIPGAADFRLIDRLVVDHLNAMPESLRFMRGMVSWLGFKQVGMPFTAAPRFAGTSKYSLMKMVCFATEGITSFSTRPLRWCMYIGFFVAVSVIPYSLFAIYQHLFTNQTIPGWSSLIVAISFLGATQLISLGILGEYIGRIYTEVKRRPLFVVQEELGFGQQKESQNTNEHSDADSKKTQAA